MASLALAASIIIIGTLLIGPITYFLARLNFPAFIIYPLGLLCVIVGIGFATIGLPIWYIGLIPMYCGYISIVRVREKRTKA